MSVIRDSDGYWTFKDSLDCFGDRRTSFYCWKTKKEALNAEEDMRQEALATKNRNEELAKNITIKDGFL